MRARADLLACAGLLVVAVAWTGGALIGEAALTPEAELDADAMYRPGPPPPRTPWEDQTPILLDWPRDYTIAKGLHAGRLDLWNPYVGCGAPLWFEQGGPFFPLKAPFYAVPNRVGYSWFLFLRIVAAALGAYVLARARGMTPLLAFCAGVLFELSGSVLAQTAFGTAAGMALMPWAILAAHLLAKGRGPFIPALTLGLIGHSGHPMIILLVYLTFGVALGGHAISARREPRRILRMLGGGAAAMVLAIAMAAPVLLPLLELRANAFSYKDIDAGLSAWNISLTRTRMMTPVSLYAPGLVDFIRHENRRLFPFPFASALGVGGLMLAIAGVLLGALDAALLATLVVGLCLTLAPPPLDRIIPHLPGVQLIYPWYCWTLVSIPLTQAAAHAISQLHTPRARKRLGIALATIPFGVAAVYFVHSLPGIPLQQMVRRLLRTQWGLLWTISPLVGFAAAALAMFLLPRLRPHGGKLLGAAALIELCALMSRYNHEPRSRIVGTGAPPAVAELRSTLDRERFHAYPIRTAWPNTAMFWRLLDLREISPLPIRRYVNYLGAIKRPAQFFTEHTAIAASSPLFDQAAVRRFAVERGANEESFFSDQEPTYEDPRLRIYNNPSARARARIARRTVAVASELAAQTLLPAVDADTVLIEPAAGEPAESLESEGRAEIVDERDPDRLALEAELQRPGYLVLADTYYPGWSATVDGRPAPIHPASLAFRAVRLDAGRHAIVFEYRPASFRNGLLIGVGALCVCLGLGLHGMRRRRAA